MAVEFALVALPFFLLVFAIIELGMVFFASTTLDAATDNAARKIRTGEFQTNGAATAADFKAAICAGMSVLESGCNQALRVDVRRYRLFSDLDDAPPPTIVDSDGVGQFNPANNCFNPGGPGNIELVRAFYEWSLFTPLLNRALVTVGGDKRLLTSTMVFRNEPYGDADTGTSSC